MLPQFQGVLADLMIPKEEIGALGQVGTLHLRRQVGEPSREVVVAKAKGAFARIRCRPSSRLRKAARKFDGPQPVPAQGRGDSPDTGFHEPGIVRRITGVRPVDKLVEVIPLIGIRVCLERIGAQLIFQLIIQAVVIAVLDGYDRRRGARPESGLSGADEEARKRDEQA